MVGSRSRHDVVNFVVSNDPHIVVSGWVPWIIAAGSVCGAASAIVMFFRRVAVPFAELVSIARRDFPILADIAETFGHGGQETISAELRALAANDETSAANQKAILARLEVVAVKLTQTRHDIIGEFAGLKTGPAGAVTLVEAIERTASDLQDVRTQLADIASRLPGQ